ncbi:MAG: hypothetical protein ACQEWW_19680 [Bacillota bacterium]
MASEVIFNHYYEIGAEEYKEQDRKEKARTAAGMGLIILSWLARRFYVAKKSVLTKLKIRTILILIKPSNLY